jgi:uncharacterized protein (TIGR03435 family)
MLIMTEKSANRVAIEFRDRVAFAEAKMMTRRLFLAFFLVLLLFSVRAAAETEVKIGVPAPPLTLKEVLQAPEGIRGTWGELRGKAVVVEFWATWCGGCVDNISHLNELVEQFASRPLQFISITDETDVVLVNRFLERHPIRGWVAFDEEESTFKRYGIEGRPRTLLVDGTGVVRAITNPRSVTPQVLDDLLAGKPLDFPEVPMAPPLGLESGAPMPLLQVLIRPAAPVSVSGTSPGGVTDKNGRYEVYGESLREILSEAYQIPENRVDAPDWCSKSRFDYSVVTPQHAEALRGMLLKQTIEAAFQLKFHTEIKETPVYILRKLDGRDPNLRPATTQGKSGYWNPRKGEAQLMGRPVAIISRLAELVLGDESFDETGLSGQYDFDLRWDASQPSSLIGAIRDQLGLALVAEHRKLDHFVVDSIEEKRTW